MSALRSGSCIHRNVRTPSGLTSSRTFSPCEVVSQIDTDFFGDLKKFRFLFGVQSHDIASFTGILPKVIQLSFIDREVSQLSGISVHTRSVDFIGLVPMGEDHLELPVGYRFGRIPDVVEAQVLSGRLIGLAGKIGDEVNSVDLELGLLSSGTSANFVKSFQEDPPSCPLPHRRVCT